jgi:hypothetical protein
LVALQVIRPKLSTLGLNAPEGTWLSITNSPVAGLSFHKPVTVAVDSYSSCCGYKCRSPLRGRSEAKMMLPSEAYVGITLL